MENAIKILTCIDDKTNSNNANIFEVDFSNIQNDWKPSEFTNFALLEYKCKKPIQINFKGSFWVRSGENVDALQRDLDDLRKVKFKNTPVIVDNSSTCAQRAAVFSRLGAPVSPYLGEMRAFGPDVAPGALMRP